MTRNRSWLSGALVGTAALWGCGPALDLDRLPQSPASASDRVGPVAGSTEVVSAPDLARFETQTISAPAEPVVIEEPVQVDLPLPPMEELSRVRTELRREMEAFLSDLKGPLQDKELVEIKALYDVYDAGRFLEELDRWLEGPGRQNLLGDALTRRLAALHVRWREYQTVKVHVLQQLEKTQ